MELVIFEPEIPQNTGNIARLCAATCIRLHLIEPLGFSLEDRYLKRAGLDYWPNVQLRIWQDMASFYHAHPDVRMVMTSARHGVLLHKFVFLPDDFLVFGPETRGLPQDILNLSEFSVRIPTLNTVRSLNLSTAAGIVLYQGLISTGLADCLI